jgi:thiol-disulfide isomerase/thioredoxin
MKRRTFLMGAAAVATAPTLGLAASGQAYKPGLVSAELAAGKTVFLDFYTDWCSTCAAQHRAIEALKAENPAYEQSISFIAVDWDIHSRSDLAKSLRIPRRSTLVVLKGDEEIGRIVAGTSKRQIKDLLDAALAAATA